MMTSPLDLRLTLAITALFLSFVALFLAVPIILNARGKFYTSANGVRGYLDKIANDMNATHADIQALQTGVPALFIRAHSLGNATETAPANRPRNKVSSAVSAAKARYGEFIRLLNEWSRLSSLRIQGAAVGSRDEIGNLFSSQAESASEERFLTCANNLIEYLVEATDTKFRQKVPEAVDCVLMQLVKLAGRELLSPDKGEPWDLAVHNVLGKVSRGSNRPGTVAEVASRGLRAAQGE